ncbi:PREDICTED: alpha-(1,3)-fucosyltransferase 10 [Polistes dominula]|uniref:Fucosyltransferase n=1 Tax=Polistes dominula TaxID=743375 RepID=A0ABM1J1V5_POLDO|nr:PREDICTED: alpha-(1,3)-fucosyltransferase 10 [Polistes dominula]
MNFKIRTLTKFIFVLGILLLLIQLCLFHKAKLLNEEDNIPVILWWTPFGSNDVTKTCGYYQCYFTYNRIYEHNSQLKAILFYGSNVQINDLPNWRSPLVQWGLMNEESPRNNPMFVHEKALNLFNYSSTFSRFSNVPLYSVDLPSKEELLGMKYFLSTKEKTNLIETENLAPLLYIQSDCNTATNRDSYILELMKYIKIDSYGLCINNARLDERLKSNYLDKLNSDEFLSFVAKYKFTLAFENAVCNDYITEKLWRPLVVGSVPIYYGSPTFKDWLPNNMSAISVLDFDKPKELADYLLRLLNNDMEYEKYLIHKIGKEEERLTNDQLLNVLNKIPAKEMHHFGYYVEDFECYVCKQIHNIQINNETSIITKKHYDCPLPIDLLSGNVNENNFWVSQWNLEKCVAKLLQHYVLNNLTIVIEQFHNETFLLYNKNDC